MPIHIDIDFTFDPVEHPNLEPLFIYDKHHLGIHQALAR